ncbi:MAG: hypothetical protein KDA77_07080, partial [Planctomycetaceae bacterium]|nr:hypothetical protein [Planctomycetaceae bacterium]
MQMKIQVGDESEVFHLDRPSFCSLDSALFRPQSAPLFRQSLGMDFLKGLAKISEDGVLRTVSAKVLHWELSQVYEELKHYEDLLNYKYLYEFSNSK